MNQEPVHEEYSTQAAAYALGVLEGEDLRRFERHLAEGCELCENELAGFQFVTGQLGLAPEAVQPPASLREKLMKRVKQEGLSGSSKMRREQEQTGLTFVPQGEQGWKEVSPGLLLKTLYVDEAQGRMTALARMGPGCRYAPHRHDKAEELFVLEGTCYCGGRMLYSGDYHRAEAGTIHMETSTTNGCLMLVIFSPNNEMLDEQPA